eukprot:m.117931 g.117931  ORF g.117931 m.117931 type:complete len:589 (+) comp28618_c0_seq1:253-2019(+)
MKVPPNLSLVVVVIVAAVVLLDLQHERGLLDEKLVTMVTSHHEVLAMLKKSEHSTKATTILLHQLVAEGKQRHHTHPATPNPDVGHSDSTIRLLKQILEESRARRQTQPENLGEGNCHAEVQAAVKTQVEKERIMCENDVKSANTRRDKAEALLQNVRKSIPNGIDDRLAQLSLPVKALQPIPLIGGDKHPWRMENIRKETTRPVFLVTSNQTIESTGDTRGCNVIDVHFIQTELGRCSILVPDRTIKTRLFEVQMNNITGDPLPLQPVVDNPGFDSINRGPNRDLRLQSFIKSRGDLTSLANAKLRRLPKSTPVLVMCANAGHITLLLNWACSLVKHKIEMPPHLIFTSTSILHDSLTKLGFTCFYHEAFGEFPTAAADVYGDFTFGQMMYLKQFSVGVALETGRDVVFQDLDLTWLSNPIPMLQDQSKFYHAQFQDDNSRQERFAPFFANSGFFYLKNTATTKWFWEHVTFTLPNRPQGNQVIVDAMLQYFVRYHNFKLSMLSFKEFMSGAYIMHPIHTPKSASPKPIFEEAKVMHFCWTTNFQDKILKMKHYNQLFVSEKCVNNISTCFQQNNENEHWRDTVCIV